MDADFRRISPALRKTMVESVEPVVIAIGKIEEVDLRERIKNVVGVDLWK
jgi:vacuolar-type H+-ATPase subunit F/Vma7